MLEAGLLHGAGAKNLAQLVEPDLFANVELDKNEHRPAQRRLDGYLSHARGFRAD